jgi:hypothetical protein
MTGPRLDLSLPDPRRQIADLCVEFPQHDLADIVRICRMVDLRLEELRRTGPSDTSAGHISPQ